MRQLGEYVKMAMKNIWANKVRTLLTMLGIIIGISSVILIISIGNGATEMISGELGSLGKGQIGFMLLDYQEKYYVTEEDIEYIRALDGVKAVATQTFFEGSTSTRKDDFKVNLVAINADGFNILEYDFAKGRAYTEKEADTGKAYCVITEDDAMKMYGSTNVVGMEFAITISDWFEIPVTVIGVAKSEDSSNMVAALTETQSIQVIIPPESLTKTTGMDIQQEITEFYVLKEDDADAKAICDAVIEYLGKAHYCDGDDVYFYQSFDDVMKTVNSVINLITTFVAFVASVSLLVGGIGVMNIMLVSVTERTREIGIRKALGAKTGSITVQFLAESAFITLIGGVIGILLGVGGASVIASVIGMMVPELTFKPALSLGTILLASAFSSAVGLFFGIYPARKAAKLSPIEALRQN
ncbi:MAG: FtsX-like permease family protein [Lachnospiraceae bacterium]|nr:FtsX-like permease family protein [Lachnospiraceae bacterium]